MAKVNPVRDKRTASAGARETRTGLRDKLASWRKHHATVASNSLVRLLREPISTTLTWLVLAIALALPAMLYVVMENISDMSRGWDGSAQISLFLHPSLSTTQGRALAKELQSSSEVAEASYQTPDGALEDFQRISGMDELLQGLDRNPLPGVILLRLSPDQSADQARRFADQLASRTEIDQVVIDLEWVQRLQQLMELGQRGVLLLGFLLAIGVVLAIGNTVRLAIESRRDEIIVVKLVGATDAFVRRPFLYGGLWYGVGGGVLAWLIVQLGLLVLSGPVSRLANLYLSDFTLTGLGVMETLWLWTVAGLLGLTGAWLAVARHLQAIEPQ